MDTRNKHDIIRERRLRQKLERVATKWTPQGDKSWQRFAKCKICREKYCINNYADRKVRTYRVLGVAVCANCFYKKGTERLVRIYKLGKQLAALENETSDLQTVNILIRAAKELFG